MPLQKHLGQIAGVIITMVVVYSAPAQTAATNAVAREEMIAKTFGWLTEWTRGHEIVQKLMEWRREHEIVQKLATLHSTESANVKISAYRDKRVAFLGVTAPPGDTHDLLTEEGFYLKLVNPSGKTLRPGSIWWEVMVCGRILQVLPQIKTIVIEVDEKDWKIYQAG